LAPAAAPRAPTAICGSGYELWFIGAQRETIMNGKLAAALDLKTLAHRSHLYGLGPIRRARFRRAYDADRGLGGGGQQGRAAELRLGRKDRRREPAVG
jgi:hypothetical protein